MERMMVTRYPPPTSRKESHSFDGARHKAMVRPMPSSAQATTPTTKGTSVEASRRRGSAVLEKNNPCHSHHQMTLRPSDSITAGIPLAKESSAEMSREKGPSCMGERKRSNATESSLAIARRALAH
ncbi:hypothetical protein AAC387_Pa08g0321 [Persea americana]